jgi:signal transduction histidine kinase
VIVPGGVYLVAADAGLAHAWQIGFLGVDPVEQTLWTVQAAALIAVVAGLMWLLASAHRRRAKLARIVVDLAAGQQPGGLRAALAKVLDDPHLELLFAVAGNDAWIDATGHERSPPTNMATTYLFREHRPVVLLCHRPGLLDDPRLGDEIERCVRLGLEHERLSAELRRQLMQLRRSRADVAAAGESERRRLEHDLHDGAQQRLVAFSFALGIGCRHASRNHAPALALAQREVQAALAELRELAHGLYPVALADAGLAAALESLRDRRPGLHTAGCGAERFAPALEETAYLTVASLAEQWSPKPVAVIVDHQHQHLVIDVRATAGPPADTLSIEDRVRALGGSLAVDNRSPHETHVRVDLPCA